MDAKILVAELVSLDKHVLKILVLGHSVEMELSMAKKNVIQEPDVMKGVFVVMDLVQLFLHLLIVKMMYVFQQLLVSKVVLLVDLCLMVVKKFHVVNVILEFALKDFAT